jgi:hypothetical protein
MKVTEVADEIVILGSPLATCAKIKFMSKWRGDEPRVHHYEFAHRALPGIAFNPRVDLAALANADHLDGALRATWAAAGERYGEADRLPDDGLQGELVEVAGEPAVLVTFPTANHAAEAFYALIAPLDPPESRRYLTLEFSWNVFTDHPTTVLGEWRIGSHVNLRPGPEAASRFFSRPYGRNSEPMNHHPVLPRRVCWRTIGSCADLRRSRVSFPLSWPWCRALSPGRPFRPGNPVHDPLTAELGQ